MTARLTAVLAAVSLAACGPKVKTDEEFKTEVATSMKQLILDDITNLKTAAQELKDAAPAGRAWSTTTDAAAITAMKTAWKKARKAYERTEGAIAPIFPDTDAAIDERYDGFLEGLMPNGDQNLFDETGVTGMHAVERILFSDVTPAAVKTAEMAVAGYKAAAYPATPQEADDFKNKLCAQLVTDITTLETQWKGAALDVPGAYQGLVDLMNEQREKVNNASAGFEESRYAQVTMTDLRNNYEGATAAWDLFHEWLEVKEGGEAIHDTLDKAFADLKKSYDAVSGEAIPAPPATWSAENPSAADLQTDFGKLYSKIREATDPTVKGSVVDQMTAAGKLFGFTSGM